MRRIIVPMSVLAVALVTAAPAWACAGLLGQDGAVPLLRTTTLAGYRDGVEHYITAFEYAGGGAEFGSIVPLPGVPSKVERGGDWTLERLVLEVQPQPDDGSGGGAESAALSAATVLQEVRIDALDLTVLSGGGAEVGRWAKEHGFRLPPDAPEVLDFYARRSPVFLAARYNPAVAAARGQQVGDGTPIHLTIPTDNPWVPLRILGLGHTQGDRVEADVFLLTERKPALLLPAGSGQDLTRIEEASDTLLTDLRGDRGMQWIGPRMWLSHLRLDVRAEDLTYDLAVDAWGTAAPSPVKAGLVDALTPVPAPPSEGALPPGLRAAGAATLVLVLVLLLAGVLLARGRVGG